MPLTPEQFRRCEELFFELRQLPLNQREAELALRCHDDPSVSAEVKALLRQDEDSRGMNISQFGGQVGQAVMEQVAFDTRALVGQRVGSYEIIDVIGQGGMGVIYLGRDVRLGRRAALKAVLPGPGNDPARAERLRREARLLASLSHPNIATVYGLEESNDTLLLAMEYIDGKTLSQRLGRHGLPLPEALAVCEKIAAALEAAHDAGVIHRDLKPGNVMFTPDGNVKVLDFGLAREVRRNISEASRAGETPVPLTRQGSFFGTPAYMSPEQARGEPLDQRSDTFSFGCVLFRCLAGRPAFDGEGDTELVDAILKEEPQWDLLPEETPASVRTLLRRCLAKNPADRYRHIGDVRLELRDAIADRAWECVDNETAPGALRRAMPWAIAAVLAIAAFFGGMLMKPAPKVIAPQSASSQRFDLTLPDDEVQKDLERIQVCIAPDGSSIMVACQTATGQELWIRQNNAVEWHRIPGTLGAHRPFLSPDGNWYGFYRDGHLFKRRLVGGEPIRLAAMTNWYGGSWTADGGIVYSPGWGGSLALIHDPSAPPRIVTRIDPDKNEGAHVSPLILPGDKWLLYNVWTGGEECSIHATDLSTGEEHVVIHNASTPRLAPTPRGDYLLFERASMIFAVPFDTKSAQTRGSESAIAEAVMNDGTRFVAYFDVAADGTLVYFPGASFAEESRLAYINTDGTTTPLNDDRLSFAEPRFSPDGNLVAVCVKGKLYRSLIYDMTRQTRQYLLTNGDTVAHAMSPDGRSIACTVNRDGGYGVDLISLADGTYKRIAQPGPDYQSDLDWSADGKFITFTTSPREGVPRDVYAVDALDPKEPMPVVTTAGEDRHGAIAPDNKWLAYSSNVSGRFEIYLAAFPQGDRMRQISLGGGEEPTWSPDGKKLYFTSPQGLMSIEISDGAAAGRAEIIYDKPFGQSDPIARNYTIAPDGRVLIVEPSERRPTVSHLHVISNWHALLPDTQ